METYFNILCNVYTKRNVYVKFIYASVYNEFLREDI